MRKNIILLLSLCLVILSCSEETVPTITLHQTELTFPAEGGSQPVSFEANMNWTAKSSASWCSISPTSGDASIKGGIAIISDNDTYDDRSCTITIMAGDLSKTITINQSSNLGLLVTQDKYDLSNDATTINVEVKANVEFDVIKSEEWITKVNTRGLSSTTLQFNIAKNSSYDNREGTITIKQKDGPLISTITVYQSQEDAIIISDKTKEISFESHTIDVELKTNVYFEVIIPDGARNWVSYSPTRALRNETLILDIAANENYEVRTTEIYLKNKATNLRDTLTIIQEKAPDLPSLTTLDAFDILINSAKSGGEISDDGGASILAKGICWDITEHPTIENTNKKSSSEDSSFVVNITDLNAATKYYVRAFATNIAGTAYGNQISFTTNSTVATPVISPKGGIYTSAQTATIICDTDEAEIRYTLDGTDPKETSELYNGGIPVNEGVTIKAKAFKTNWIDSSTATQTYIIKIGAVLIEGSSNTIQHIDASENFVFRLNNLDDKNVFFVFTNKNTNSSTALPQLQSNIERMRKAVKSIAFSESSFVVSGKPSISEFNNALVTSPADGMPNALYQQQLSSQTDKYMLGSSELLYNDVGTPQLSTVRKVISAHGKNLYVWVANNCWGPASPKRFHVTQQMVDALALKFLNTGTDNDIYEWVTNICGAPWGPTTNRYLIPETDDIHIWLMDIDDDNKINSPVTIGYFFSRDNYRKSYFSKSNEKLMFTIDAVLFAITTNGTWDVSHYWPMQSISTIAHEFTHMIYYYQKNILNGQSANIAINEMCAQSVEDLVANKIMTDGPRGVPYSISYAGSANNNNGRLPLYNSSNDYTLLNWSSNYSERLLNYSKTYALGAYLMRNYGGANFIKELIQNNSTGANSIVAAVNANGGSVINYEDILQRFGAANLLTDKTTMTVGYKFNTGSWSTSDINGINYELGAINLFNYSPTPKIYNQLPSTQKPGSNIYYNAGSSLSGTQEWYFEGMSTDTKLSIVIK